MSHRPDLEIEDTLSETGESLRLSLVQRRCTEFMVGLDEIELELEEPIDGREPGDATASANDPYNSSPLR